MQYLKAAFNMELESTSTLELAGRLSDGCSELRRTSGKQGRAVELGPELRRGPDIMRGLVIHRVQEGRHNKTGRAG
jgi:hypothetical protein